MTACLKIEGKEAIQIVVVARDEETGAKGRFSTVIAPGDSFYGHSFEELLAMGSGAHQLTPKASQATAD